MLERIKHEVISVIARVQFQQEIPPQQAMPKPEAKAPAELNFRHDEVSALEEPAPMAAAGGGGAFSPGPSRRPPAEEKHEPYVRDGRKVGRNEPCPCGSGKKFKQCHGRLK